MSSYLGTAPFCELSSEVSTSASISTHAHPHTLTHGSHVVLPPRFAFPDDRHDVLCNHHAGGPDELWGCQASHPVPQRGAVVETGQEHLLHALLDDLWGSVCGPDRP